MMIISIIPLTASAATVTGTCGDNLIWTYDTSTYTLTISGTDAMNDYVYNHPWKSYEDSNKNVFIEIGVTSIVEDAFYSCDSLTNITIPDSVTSIGRFAFLYCYRLTDVYYSGTKEQWNNISIESDNSYLISARIHYNYIPDTHITSAIITPPTCTAKGYTTYTCVCGYSYKLDYINATGHTYNAVVTAPTCTSQGFTTYTCACGNSYVANYVAPHNLEWVTLSIASCTTNGVMHGYCQDCTYYEVQTTPMTGHADNDGDGKCDSCPEILDPTINCNCNCHKSGISNFFFKFALFFQKIFGSNKECACGVAHY